MSTEADFDLQAAWLRRFRADAQSNLRAFALRLKEAMPDAVHIHESKGLFSRSVKTTGVTVQIDENRYVLEIADNRLRASVAMVVRGIALSTKTIDPAEWFARLSVETRKASDNAKALSQSIANFMAT